MAQFTVSAETLTSTASSIRSIDGKFIAKMEEIEGNMNKLKAKWDSDAANAFIAKFRGLKSNFDNYSKVIISYAKFLDDAAEAYKTTEKKINTATMDLFS